MGPLEESAQEYYAKFLDNPAFNVVNRDIPTGHTSTYDGSKWVTTTTTTSTTPPGGISWTGTSTSSAPPAWSLPKVDLASTIQDPHIRSAVEDLIYADRVSTNNDMTIEHINSAIKLLSKKVIELLGEE